MISEEDRIKNMASWVRGLNELNWTNKKIANTLGLNVIEVSEILLGE